MQVTVTKPETGLEHEIVVTLPADTLNEQVDRRLAQMRREVRMDGFRPGKVPLRILKKRYGGQIRAEEMEKFVYDALYRALDQEGLSMVGFPRFEDVKDDGETVTFRARFDVMPEMTLPALETLEIEKVEGEITDEDVEQMIDRLREQKKVWRPVEGKAAENGDQVMMDFEGRLDGEPFEGGRAENVPLVLGSGRMIPGFEEGILGMKAGEEKTITVTFPEDYHAEHLAGKDVEFLIRVHSVQVAEKPEVDAEFVKQFGVDDGDVETFRKEIRENMAREMKRLVEARNRNAVLKALDEAAASLELPGSLVDQEIQTMMQNQLRELQMQGVDPAQVKLNAEDFRERAEQRVRLGLVINHLIRELDIKVSDEEVENYIREQAAAYEDPEEVIQWYHDNPQHLDEVRGVLLENKVADAVMAQANTQVKRQTFTELTAAG